MTRMKWSLVFPLVCSLAMAQSSMQLSTLEQEEIELRIQRFYQDNNDVMAMNLPSPKFSVNRQKFVKPHQELLLKGEQPTHPLLKSAQVKGTPAFEKHYCETFLRKHFPEIKCGNAEERRLSAIQSVDRAEELADGWTDILHDLDKIPTTGKAEQPLWSDDYWRTRWGVTSFRYSEYDPEKEFKTWKEAVNSYAQPSLWNGLVGTALPELTKAVTRWSPAEKYDLSVGDTGFTLTNQQKNEGLDQLGPDGNVEEWVGICHGWAPAALVVDRPKTPTKLLGARGVEVEWYPNDVKAMITLAWANGSYESTQAGRRCNNKKPQLLPNGRVKAQDCWDTNPATFHLALGNMLGRRKVGFVIDKTFDYEVWNQPVVDYKFTYFNPLNPAQRSQDWRKVAVPYDRTFKRQDRFQKPLTRGKIATNRRMFRRAGDGAIEKIVGVIATVSYLVEYTPEWDPGVQADELERETYIYDLELVDNNGVLEAEGGEWHNNIHPDFLWVPRPRETAHLANYDLKAGLFNGESIPAATFTDVAIQASGDNAYPLCRVMKELIKRTTGSDTYYCP